MGTEEIRRLSQDEGMKDIEIALMLGIHRTTVTRVRIANDIPRAKVINRKDKRLTCNQCGERYIVRRWERIYRCPTCRVPEPEVVNSESEVYAY